MVEKCQETRPRRPLISRRGRRARPPPRGTRAQFGVDVGVGRMAMTRPATNRTYLSSLERRRAFVTAAPFLAPARRLPRECSGPVQPVRSRVCPASQELPGAIGSPQREQVAWPALRGDRTVGRRDRAHRGDENEDDAWALLCVFGARLSASKGSTTPPTKPSRRLRSRAAAIRHLARLAGSRNYLSQGKKGMARKDLRADLGR